MEEIGSCLKRFRCAGSDYQNEEISFHFGPNWVCDQHQQDDSKERYAKNVWLMDVFEWKSKLIEFNPEPTRAEAMKKLCLTSKVYQKTFAATFTSLHEFHDFLQLLDFFKTSNF